MVAAPPGRLRLVPRLVQLVHRHGDRTPITKLNESERAFWRAQLPGIFIPALAGRQHTTELHTLV